uniref:Tyrosine-protein phosphatase domain-containing protein n=1 Tax=Caenorhabditis tropicalis TaxID=1561998 RepID=A0A1I7T9F6_9PELO
MGSKSSKNVQQLKCSKTLDSEGTTMSIEMENTQMEKENTRNKTLAIEEESEESSPEYSEELESRASSGIESEISQEDSGEEEEMDQENVPEEEESLEEELRSDRTVEDEEIQNYEIDSIREELSYQMDLNPDPSNSIDNQLDEQADVESLYSQPSSQVEEDERIVCGADTMEYDRLQNILSNEFLQENNISFGENSFELEEEQKSPYLDDYSSIEFSTSSYPIEKEYRQNGMIVFHVKRPFANEIQSFWKMVLEKRIPTIEICCDFIEGQSNNILSNV